MAEKPDFPSQVDHLLELARKKVKESPALAKKYVSMARALAMRHRIPLGKGRKMKFCPSCGIPWIAGYNLTVRLRSRERKAEYACKCGAALKIPYSGKK
jgi:RNase P subunit RPR2